MISGMYLGEVARQVLLRLAKDGCLFKGHISDQLNTPMMFYTKYLSEIERYMFMILLGKNNIEVKPTTFPRV